jgi:hypothetical protein
MREEWIVSEILKSLMKNDGMEGDRNNHNKEE